MSTVSSDSEIATNNFFFTRLRNDFCAAFGSSFLLSPFVCSVDKCIISNASGRQLLGPCLKENLGMVFMQPHKFAKLKEFHLIWGVYFATYVSANLTDTTCRYYLNCNPLTPVFLATTCVNMTTCILKDREFTKMFANLAKNEVPKPSLPPLTYLLFAIRDSLTIMASFSLVPYAGTLIYNNFGDKSQGNGTLSKERSTQIAQISCPIGIQFISTPLHLYALDLYNNPTNKARDRMSFIGREYFKTVAARAARILPAFGFGGVGNTFLRKKFGEYSNIN